MDPVSDILTKADPRGTETSMVVWARRKSERGVGSGVLGLPITAGERGKRLTMTGTTAESL